MTSWPSLPEPHYPIKETSMQPAYRNGFDAPYTQSRKKYSGMVRVFAFAWDDEVPLPEADYKTLLEFFNERQGEAFSWTKPNTQDTYSVIFDQDEIESDTIVPGYHTASIRLRTVGPVT